MRIAVREMDHWLDAIEELAESDPLGAARQVEQVQEFLADWVTVTSRLKRLSWERTKAFYELSDAALAREMGVSPSRVRQVLRGTAK